MRSDIYTFKIEVEDLEDKIWRKVEITSTSNISKLAYTVLASFETAMYHLFSVSYKDMEFDNEADQDFAMPNKTIHDARKFRLQDLKLNINDELEMTYDFGVCWTFKIKLLDIKEMKDYYIVDYPMIIDGAGLGIMEDRHSTEVLEIIEEIDKTGKVTEESFTKHGTFEKWDYRKYDVSKDNKTLHDRLYKAIVAYEELTDL